MLCPQCQTENPDQARFCLNCGLPLAQRCPQCGTELPAAARFCFGCGAAVVGRGPLPSPPPPAAESPRPSSECGRGAGEPGGRGESLAAALQRLIPQSYAERLLATRGQVQAERRLVTVLRADVRGSTALAERLDPEEWAAVMNGAFDFLIGPVLRHEGTLARLMGDAILALFGAPLAHEDDPARACRAGLEIAAGAADYAAHLERERGLSGFGIRVGIHTGLVVVGEIGSDLRVEYGAVGEVPALAERLEQAAPPGGVLISRDTYQQIRGLFDVQAVEPLAVAGRAEPPVAYLLQRARPRAFRLASRGIEGVETALVGREAELKRLQEAFYTALEDGEVQMVTLVGEPGVGKTRLLFEFEGWLEQQPRPLRYFRARANPEGQQTPYALLHDLLALRCDIQDSDPAAVMREKVERGVTALLGSDAVGQMKAHFLGQLAGFDFSGSPHLQAALGDAQQLRDRALLYLGELLQVAAAPAMAVLLLEDLHWADDSSLDALNQLTAALAARGRTPLLIVGTARPALYERRPHWGEGQPFHTRLDLLPLSRRDSRLLVEEILQKVAGLPEALRDLVAAGAEGNPLYMEEMVKVLIAEGIVIKDEPRWRVEMGRLEAVQIPATLTAVLQARLDSLSPEQRAVLQQAAVVGRTFWDSAVARLGQDAGAEVPAVLAALRSREMVARREVSAFAGAQEFVFRHAALREVAYESMLRRVRQGYHAIVADWLIEQGGDRRDEYTGLIAEHLDRAGRTAEAARYLRRAGEQAAARFANAEAVNYLTRALEYTSEEEAAVRYDLLRTRERVYDLQGMRAEQQRDLTAMSALAERLDDDHRRMEVLQRRADHAYLTGDYPASIAAAQEAVDLARRLGDKAGEAAGLHLAGRALRMQGNYEEARAHAAQALDIARANGLLQVEAQGLVSLGTVCHVQGDSAAARTCFEQARAIFSRIGDRRGESRALGNLGVIAAIQGDFATARTCFEQDLAINREIGDRYGESTTILNLGALTADQGNYAGALAFYRQGLLLKREVGDRAGEGDVLSNLGASSIDCGDQAGARAYYEEALRVRREIGDREGQSLVLSSLGLIAERQGDYERALELGREALALAQEIGSFDGQVKAEAHMGHALAGLARWDEAAAAYRRALDMHLRLGECGITVDLRAGLARVALAQGDLAAALSQVEALLQHAQDRPGFEGAEEPLRIYLACYQVLRALQDPRAAAVLETAHGLLQERAGRISEEAMRRSFLEGVPAHRALLEEWDRRSGATS